jgi:hypothetical protein
LAVARLAAQMQLRSNQARDNQRETLKGQGKREAYIETHDPLNDSLYDGRYIDKVPDYNADGSLKFDEKGKLVWRKPIVVKLQDLEREKDEAMKAMQKAGKDEQAYKAAHERWWHAQEEEKALRQRYQLPGKGLSLR